MSDKCPDKVKAAWAFRVYGTLYYSSGAIKRGLDISGLVLFADYDDDGIVSEEDIVTVIDQLTTGSDPTRVLEPEEKQKIARVVGTNRFGFSVTSS